MYGKIFSSMYEGSLYGRWQAIVTFQQLIVLADEDGVVDMTPPAIAARTSIPLEIIEQGIEILEQEDKYSRSDKLGGKRIVPVDESRPWGWQIVNYRYYRDMASREDKKRKDRERIAEKRAKSDTSQNVADSRNESHEVANVAHTNTDTDRDIKQKQCASVDARFESFYSAYPLKKDKGRAEKTFKKLNPDDPLLAVMLDAIHAQAQERALKKAAGEFVPEWKYPASWLNAESWQDEVDLTPRTGGNHAAHQREDSQARGKRLRAEFERQSADDDTGFPRLGSDAGNVR